MSLKVAVSALLCGLSLTSCAPSKPIEQTRIVKTTIPASLLECADDPIVPSDPVTDRKVGRWIVNLIGAHDDCAGKVKAIKELVGNE
ncbi:Rz1-like lysis system protein LysC [Thalassospira marina]|uniref:Rz1-like lysis system protein LysC n=1 Tax=Thalassospira marina TaxID=2048283 RepID=UPI003F5C2C48